MKFLSTIGSDIADAITGTLGSWGMWSAITATISVIMLGFFLAVKGIFAKEWEKVLVKVVMVVGLPALALNGFLSDATVDQLIEQMTVLLTGFAFYTIMMFTSKYFFFKYEKDLQDTFAMCIALASTTFFGIPIVTAIYQNAVIPANIFNIPYRIFLYSMAFMVMSKKPMIATKDGVVTNQKETKPVLSEAEIIEKKKIRKQTLKNIFLNPILIATIVGFIIWVTQLIPGIDLFTRQETVMTEILDGMFIQETVERSYSIFRIDIIFPPSATILSTLQAICTPLAWLAIGMTMAKGNLKEAFKDKKLWYAASIKVLVAPIIILVMICGVAWLGYGTGWFTFSKVGMAAMVIMTAAPPANVVVAYAISYEKGARDASNLTTLSTLLSVVTLPIWVIIVTAVGALPLFS